MADYLCEPVGRTTSHAHDGTHLGMAGRKSQHRYGWSWNDPTSNVDVDGNRCAHVSGNDGFCDELPLGSGAPSVQIPGEAVEGNRPMSGNIHYRTRVSGNQIERKDLLPGWSATKWSGTGLAGGAVWIIGTTGGAICAVTLVRQNRALDPVTWSFLALFVVGLALLAFGVWMMQIKEKKEVASGYTTMAQGHYDVERRHSPTGVIMRRAGQPALARPQWEQAMAVVRTYERESDRASRRSR